jgi:hypothetical protein
MLDWMLPENMRFQSSKRIMTPSRNCSTGSRKQNREPDKERIIAKAVTELKIHAVIEEELFYPAVRKHVGKDIMNEADEEHHVARVLIAASRASAIWRAYNSANGVSFILRTSTPPPNSKLML